MFLLLVTFITLLCFYNCYWKRRNFPPGPVPLPLIGNMTQMDFNDINVKKFKEWREKYGPVMTVWTGEEPSLLFTTYDVMVKYFVKQSEVFSNRWRDSSTFMEVRGGFYGIVPTSGDQWRENRRFALHTLRNFGLGKNQMEERILTEVEALFDNVNNEISKNVKEVNLSAFTDLAVGSVINTIICGYRFSINNREEEFYAMKKRVATFFKAITSPVARIFLKHSIINRYWPFSNPIHDSTIAVGEIFDFLQGQTDIHMKEMDYTQEFEPRDFIDAFLLEKTKRDLAGEGHLFSILQLKNVCFDLWSAGQETTSSALQWIFAFLTINQDVQQKVHEELDKLIGSNRLITTTDKTELHYTNAAITEAFRCANIILTNVPRATAEEVIVEGYRIPENTMIFPCLGMLLRDDKAFPNPDQLDPTRFLDSDGHFQNNELMLPFSLGKRQCLGEGLARMELFLFTANILNHYVITPGEHLPSLQKNTRGALSHKPYTVVMKKRI